MIEKIFNINVDNLHNVYVTNNEIYNQFLLYIFSNIKKDILLVVPTLSDANEVYNNLKSYIDNVYIFPEDDFITKKAIATSPELLFLRLKILNDIVKKDKKIVISHVNSFIKKLPNKNEFKNSEIILSKDDIISRDQIINKLNENKYNKESIVYNTSEYAVRGFVLDIYPIHEEYPVRIEFFDEKIEKIKYFDPISQESIKEIETISIKSLNEEFGNKESSLIEYLNNPLVIYTNYEEIKKQEKIIKPQIKYLNIEKELFNLNELFTINDLYINTINNKGKYDLIIESKSIETYNEDIDRFLQDINKNNGILYTTNKNIIDLVNKNSNKIKIINGKLNKGFVYNNKYYYSDNDLFLIPKRSKLTSDYKYGRKIDGIDKLKEGDYVVHKKSGIGIYCGIKTITKNGLKKDYVLIQYKGNDKLYLPVEDIDRLYKYTSKEGAKPTIHKLNSIEWTKTKIKIKERIKDITDQLLKIYKERNLAKIIPFMEDDENQIIFENSFIHEETEDQIKASIEIKKDLEKSRPMDRLLCGDVGYGKTEVIFRAIFKTIINNKQVVYLCPTTILSHQQYANAKIRFANYGINIDIVNRHFTNKEVQNKLKKLKDGQIDLIFGTHRLLSSDVIFKDLGLLVIDEEHKFGVEQKEKIKALKSNVHILSVSATPIPRSLQMSLVGIRDLSLIETPPKDRLPVQTYVIEYNDMLIREAILKEKERKGQVFILYNNTIDMDKKLNYFKKLVPEVTFCFAHGKMNKNEMQDIIYDFTNKHYDVLISTTIIENGIDIPNANTIIVIDADRYGLSQLYQIRGRVGRSDKIAYAYLMYKKEKILSTIAIKRLEAIKEFTELGSGYKISMRDLAIRGAGDILGSEQAGFIDSVGVDMYLELINEGINNIEEDEIESDKLPLVSVETHIGDNYSTEDFIIIELHKKINSISSKKDLDKVLNEIKDRFGILDNKLLIYAHEKYMEKLIVKTGVQITENDNIKITLRLKESIYKNINIETLFVESQRINTKFNFMYKNNDIFITLLKASLDKNYIFYVNSLCELIDNLK